MDRERREGEYAWAPAELPAGGEAPARKPRRASKDATLIVGTVIALLVVAGVGVIAWQLVSFLR